METFIEKLKELNMSKFDIDSLDQSIMQLKKQYNELMDNYSIQLDKIIDDINNDINILKNYCFKKNDDIYRFIGLFGIVEEGQVKNVSVINSHFESKGAVGAICGLAVGGYDNENNKEKWAKIKNCSGENNIVVQLDKEDWDHPYNELVGVVDNAIVE